LDELPLAAASRRLRRLPGRPRTHPVKLITAPPTDGARQRGPTSKPKVAPWSQSAGVTPRLLGVRQAAAYLGLSPWTVRDLESGGTLARVRLPVRKLLFGRVELDRLIANASPDFAVVPSSSLR
jgi:hypothetical protein